MMNAMTQITTNIIRPKNTKPTTTGTANSSNEKQISKFKSILY